MHDCWHDIPFIRPTSKERVGYPTQKPLALLNRIIATSSNEGDIILDPFCGCATTCVAAEQLGRKWIGIDISVKAYDIIRERLTEEIADPENLFDVNKEITFSTVAPKRTDKEADNLTEQKYVYVISHPHYPNEYKVGIAKDWKSRLNSYQTSDPDRAFNIEYKKLTPYFRETESYIHDTFPNKHEWVTGKLEDIKRAIENYQS